MWRRWAKPSSSSPSKTVAAAATSSNHFSYSGLRDVPDLITTAPAAAAPAEDSNKQPQQHSPKRSVFHRLHVATARLRAGNLNYLPEPAPAPAQRQSPTKLAAESEGDELAEAAEDPWSPESHNASPLTPLEPWCTSLPPGSETRIVVYFTSLRVVRPTFQDCRAVRSILRGFRVSTDERDLSMDSGFLDELKGVMGLQDDDDLTLPRVFIGGRYIGGAEEVRHLHETGELKKLVEGLHPAAEPGVCEACGGYKFLLCHVCNGSHKCPSEESGDGGFRSCSSCNENGLIRCPSCVPSDPSI